MTLNRLGNQDSSCGELMPTVEINKKRLCKMLGKKLSDDELNDRIAMLGTDVEGIEGNIITVEAFPNRPDLLSEEGLARALRGFLGIETGLKGYTLKTEGGCEVIIDDSVKKLPMHATSVKNAVIKGVKITEEFLANLMQIQEKLHITHARNRKKASIGVYDMDTLKPPIKFTNAKKTDKFIPLGFDHEMTMEEVKEKHPKGQEYGYLLGKNEYPAWIDSTGKILSLVPLINSKDTAVTTETTNMFLDVKGADEKVVSQTFNIIVSMFIDHGAEVCAVTVNGELMDKMDEMTMQVSASYINKYLGLELTTSEIKKYLERMRFGVTVTGDELDVQVPIYRTDIMHPRDFVEEVAIAYGYENFNAEIPNVSTLGKEDDKTIMERKLAEMFVGMQLLECNTYHLSSKEVLLKKMRLDDEKLVQTTNNVNLNYDTVRNALLPGLVQVLGENTHYEYPQNLFDLGVVVHLDKGKIKEQRNAVVVISHAKTDFTEIKSALDSLFVGLGKEYTMESEDHPSFLEGRCGVIKVEGNRVGVIGEMHPEVLNNFNIEVPVTAFELNADML